MQDSFSLKFVTLGCGGLSGAAKVPTSNLHQPRRALTALEAYFSVPRMEVPLSIRKESAPIRWLIMGRHSPPLFLLISKHTSMKVTAIPQHVRTHSYQV
jgi:hypothetical protein